MTLTRIKVLTGYAAHARFFAELSEDVVGYVPRQIPTDRTGALVYVVVAETRHRPVRGVPRTERSNLRD